MLFLKPQGRAPGFKANFHNAQLFNYNVKQNYLFLYHNLSYLVQYHFENLEEPLQASWLLIQKIIQKASLVGRCPNAENLDYFIL